PEDLDERAHVLEKERARDAPFEDRTRLGGKPIIEEGVTEGSEPRTIVEDDQFAGRALEPCHDGAPSAASRVGAHALVERRVGVPFSDRERLDEHLDRAAARETDLPRFLV